MNARIPSVLFVVRGDESVPSCRFRAYQLRAPLEKLGVRVDYLRMERAKDPVAQARFYVRLAREAGNHDAVVYQKSMHPFCIRVARTRNANVFYDFDDALYAKAPRRFAHTLRASAQIIAGNATLAAEAGRHHPKVHVIPTSIVLPTLQTRPAPHGLLRLSWIGTADNLHYLEPVYAALQALGERGISVELEILTERPERVVPHPLVSAVRWSLERERAAFERCEIGLMPLVDDAWSRGKCACKALQYLSYAKPVITSPVGMNRELFAGSACGVLVDRASDWQSAILSLATRRDELPLRGIEGRSLAARFDVEVWAPRLRDVLFSSFSRRIHATA